MRDLFPKLVSYKCFNARQDKTLLPLLLYFKYRGLGKSRGVNYIYYALLRVCRIKREKQHSIFKDVAAKGKSSTGWFFGFKLHLIINDRCELLSFYLTKGNVDDRNIGIITAMTKNVFGKLFRDRGYIYKALAEHYSKMVFN